MITVEEVKALVQELAETRQILKNIEDNKKPIEKRKGELEIKLAGMLKEMKEKAFVCEYGRITRVTNFSVKLPQGEEKLKFFDYLRQRDGLFDAMATINYQTLNSFFKAEWEEAKKQDPMAALNFSLPGIGEAKSFETIQFRKNNETTEEGNE